MHLLVVVAVVAVVDHPIRLLVVVVDHPIRLLVVVVDHPIQLLVVVLILNFHLMMVEVYNYYSADYNYHYIDNNILLHH